MSIHKLNRNAVVAILGLDKHVTNPVGTGFFISPQRIITCSHVVGEQCSDQIIYVRTEEDKKLETRVETSYQKDSSKEDIVILEVVDSESRSEYLKFGNSNNTEGHNFETYGFPKNHEFGLEGKGKIGGIIKRKSGIPLIQLTSGEVVPGFSGAPVFDVRTGRVIGMVSEKVLPDHQVVDISKKKKEKESIVQELGLRETALATPSSVIRDICKDLIFDDICPYQGLSSFTEKTSNFFCGRDKLVDKLIGKISQSPQFLLVTGTSGSGKSSIIKAKLLPRLESDGVISTDRTVFTISVRLGNKLTPEKALERLFERKGFPVKGNIWNSIKDRFHNNSDRLIIFIDQFEELFTTSNANQSEAFLAELNHILNCHRSVTLILASRIEFESNLENSPLRGRLNQGTLQVRGIEGDDLKLHEIIVEPAEKVGLLLDEGLADKIISDLGSTINPLPLLEFTLTELWRLDIEKYEKNRLTYSTYKETFKESVNVLQRRADEVYNFEQKLSRNKQWVRINERGVHRSEEQKKLIKSIFGRLIWFGSNNIPDTRCRVSRLSLEEIDSQVNNLLNQLIGVGLLVLVENEEENKKDHSIEIVHDVLISIWLSDIKVEDRGSVIWIGEQREFRRWQQKMVDEISSWKISHQSNNYLLTGGRLVKAEEYLGSHQNDLLPEEIEYIQKSLEERESQLLENQKREQDRIEKEAKINSIRQEKELIEKENGIITRAVKNRNKIIAVGIVTLIPISIVGFSIAYFADKIAQFSRTASHSDQLSRDALRQFPSGQLDALRTAIDAGRELKDITQDISNIQDYPTISPITVLRKILTDIQEFNHFNAGQGEVRSAIFLPGGDRVITAGAGTNEGDALKLWTVSGKMIVSLNGHQKGVIDGGVNRISIGGNQQDPLIASAGGDGTVKLWNASGNMIASLEVPGQKEKKSFTSIAVSPDGQRIIVGQSDGMVYLWERSGKFLKSWSAHSQTVTGITFSGDSQKIATSGEDGLVRVWASAGTKSVEFKSPNVKKFMNVSFSSDGKFLATASDDGLARIWTVAGQEVAQLKGHEGVITVANFSPDGGTIATAGDDGTVKLWDVKTRKQLQDFRGHRGVVWTASFSQDGKQLVSTGRDGEVRLWSLDKKSSEIELNGFSEDVNAIAFSPDGKSIVGAGNEGVMRQWDRTGKEIKVWKKAIWQGMNVQDLAFSSDGKFVLASGLTSIARVWKIDENNGDDEPFIKLKGDEVGKSAHQGDILSIAISPNGELIATGSVDKTIGLWRMDPPYGELKKRMDPQNGGIVSRVVFTAGGKQLVSSDWLGNVRFWDLEGNLLKEFKNVHSTQIRGLGVTPDGKRFVTADKMGDIKISDMSGKMLKEFKSYQSGINELLISPDGQFIATAGMDKTARVWDFQGRQVAEFYNPKGAVWGVAFSSDSRSIAIGGDKGFAIVRPIKNIEELMSNACQWLKASSFHQECQGK